MKFFLICFAGAAGTGVRYLLSGFVNEFFASELPLGTFLVNAIGSFLIGCCMHVGLTLEAIHPDLRVILSTGFLGGFTTYASFNQETLLYFYTGDVLSGMLNLISMSVLCLLMGVLGWYAVSCLL